MSDALVKCMYSGSPGDIWLGCLAGAPRRRCEGCNGGYEFVARVSTGQEDWTRATLLCGASRCHRRQCSFYFPVLLVVRRAYELRASTRMRVHVPLDVTLAQTSSIARQLAATGASRGSSRSSSKAGSLVAQHPAATNFHTSLVAIIHLPVLPFRPPSFNKLLIPISPSSSFSVNIFRFLVTPEGGF